MPSPSPSPPAGGRGCVYDTPIALDPTLMRTNGLEPGFAKSRNLGHIRDSKYSFLGPMPVLKFIDYFLLGQPSVDKTSLLPSQSAFQSVPSCGDGPADVYRPLVSMTVDTS